MTEFARGGIVAVPDRGEHGDAAPAMLGPRCYYEFAWNRQEESMRPTVGRIVHYVSHGSPVRPDGSQAYKSECRAAIVTEVSGDGLVVGLMVANPVGQFFNRGTEFHDGSGEPGDPQCLSRANHGNPFRYCACGWTEPAYAGGSWHWPEREG